MREAVSESRGEIAAAGETGAPVAIEARNAPAAKDDPRGIALATACYAIWGIVPLYWRLLANVSPWQITAHRVLWCALFAAGVSLARGRRARLLAIARNPRLLATLALTGVLIAVNWTIYIYCVAANRLVEASLGYYIVPLISIALGVALLGERLSRVRLFAVLLAATAVAAQCFEFGSASWIAPALALSFGFYGYFRKRAEVDAMDGLAIETAILFPLTLGAILFWQFSGAGAFGGRVPLTDALLILGGPLTAVPLAMFAAGARRIRLSTLGFLQYLSPSITLTLAIFGFGEKFTVIDAATFGCVWVALIVVAAEGRVRAAR